MAAVLKRGRLDAKEPIFNPGLSPHDHMDQKSHVVYPNSKNFDQDLKSKESLDFGGLGIVNITSVQSGNLAPEDYKSMTFTGQDDCNTFYEGSLAHDADLHCNATWDTVMCWPPTPAGENSYLNCPPIKGVDVSKFAFRVCNTDGLWLNKHGEGDYGIGFTDYTQCFIPEVKVFLNKLYAGTEEDAHIKYLVAKSSRAVEIIGLSLSLVSLLVSLFIFTYFKKLHNNRIRIHKNQFLAMLLQVMVRLILYIDQSISGNATGLFSPLVKDQYGIDNTPILCEAFYVLLEYGRSAMFMWMFIEAMYLNNLISVAFFQGPADYRTYYLIGWGIPVLMTSLWAVVMAVWGSRNSCWLGYSMKPFYWILEGPRFTVIVANLLFLLNIMRILISKLREANSSEVQQIRPLHSSVRNALFLLPLLGITNAVTIIPTPLERSAFAFGVWSYGTNLLTSFQGFVVACIYCFFNADIKRTLCYIWRLNATAKSARKSMNDGIHTFSNQDGCPKMHYKAKIKSCCEHPSPPTQLHYLHPRQLATIHNQKFQNKNTASFDSPFENSNSPPL